MTAQLRVPTRFRLLAVLMVVAAGAAFWPAAAPAQDDKPYAVFFSDKPGDKNPRATMPLRANQLQDFYIYVQNKQKQKATLKVEVRAGNKVLDGGVGTANMDPADPFSQVVFGKPAPMGEKPPAQPPAPQPPAFAQAQGTLKVVILDGQNPPIEKEVNVTNPQSYVDVTEITFDPREKDGHKNQLRVKVKANEEKFAGPRCRVDLVLDSKRIPGLVDSKLSGTRGGYLGEPGAELMLTADNLEFVDNKDTAGPIYLTIDGWERAYTYKGTFDPKGTGPSTPSPVTDPVVRLLAPDRWNPAQPLPIGIEADNLKSEQAIQLAFDRDADGKFSSANGEIAPPFRGNRQTKFQFNPAYPGGALQLKPEMKDWQTELEVAETFGPRVVRVRLMKDEAEAKKSDGTPEEFYVDITKKLETEILHSVLLDASPPAGIKIVVDKKRLNVGDPLPVSATCDDPKTVKQVVFFVGKLDPDGKIPKTAILVPGEKDKDKDIWSADLDAPTNKKGKFDVTAQFVKTTGVAATDTIKIELVDPNAKPGVVGGGGKASIEGKITDVGGAPQGAGVPVELRDDKGNVKDTTKTDEKSHYIFKDLMPGTYQIVSVRTATRTKGSIIVQLKDGEVKKDVDVGLSR